MGIGYKLYDSLICDLKSRGFHTAIAIMAAPNEASSRLVFHLIFNLYHDFYNHIPTYLTLKIFRLHQKLGFEFVGQMKEIGCKFNQMLDRQIWQKIL